MHIPKSKMTSKDLSAAMRYVRESANSVAISAANREKEEARKRARLYQDVKVKQILLDSITGEIGKISKKIKSEPMDMYDVVEELCKDGVMERVSFDVARKVEEFDGNPDNENKINPSKMNLIKTIERDYMLYMIEFLVRAEIERMKTKKMSTQEMMRVLNLDKRCNYEERGKALRQRVRAVIRPLYGLPEKEQRIDKLREETRTVMKNMAYDLELKDKHEQIRKNSKQTAPSAPDTDNR